MVRALMDIKDLPLQLALDMYNNILTPSIADESKADYCRMCESLEYSIFTSNREGCMVDWSTINNDINFTKKLISFFGVAEVPWLAYESINFILMFSKNGQASTAHLFHYNRKPYIVSLYKESAVLLSLPGEIYIVRS